MKNGPRSPVEFEREWSYERAANLHALLDAIEDAEARARAAARRPQGA